MIVCIWLITGQSTPPIVTTAKSTPKLYPVRVNVMPPRLGATAGVLDKRVGAAKLIKPGLLVTFSAMTKTG
jgi:hypothetical protein